MIPSEISIAGIYMPPSFLAAVVGFLLASVIAKVLNRTRLSRFIWHPPLAFMAIWAIASGITGLILIAL